MSALDDVSKGLRRNDAELAVSALLKVASAERESVLPAVGALFRQAVLEVHRRGEWSRGVFWAARAEKEPRLYGLPDSDDHRAVLWALMWAAAISREFERAARLWALVRPQVEAKAPALALAIEAHIASRGSPPPALIAALNVPEPDPRLGREPTQSSSKLTLPAPTTLVSVESSVLAACSGLPWAQFADTVTTWVRTATPELARTIATLATSLAVRELLVRFSEAANSQRSVPGLLVAELIRQVGAQATMSEDVLLAFRLVASDGAQQPFANEQAARPFCALASATAAYELHRPLVVRALESRLFAPAAARSGLRLLEGLATKTLPPELFAKAVALICMEQHEFVPEAPAWLRQAWELLMKEPTDFQRWISALPERERGPTLMRCLEALPLQCTEALVEALWSSADKSLRTLLARIVATQAEAMADDIDFEDTQLPNELRGLYERFIDERGSMPALAAKLLERQQGRMLGYHRAFLEVALSEAKTLGEASRYLEQHLAVSNDVVSRIDAMAEADNAGWGSLSERIVRQLVDELAASPERLGEAVEAADRCGAPDARLRPMAEALLAASTRMSATPSSALQKTLGRIRRFVKKPTKKPGAKKNGAKPRKPKKASEPPNPSGGQNDLPF